MTNTCHILRSTLTMVVAVLMIAANCGSACSQEPAQPTLVPIPEQEVAQRVKAIEQANGDRGKLAVYLDCGSQLEATGASGVQLTWIPGKTFLFPSKVEGVPTTQASVAFDESRVVFDISGLDSTRKYDVGLTWWDYDNGSRTQMVTVGSPNHRQVRMAVPAIRLPDYRDSKQLPAQKQFALPVSLARDGKMQLIVHYVTGANVVISELWIVERPQ